MLGPPLSHAAGRRQASLGTPVPRTPTDFIVPEEPLEHERFKRQLIPMTRSLKKKQQQLQADQDLLNDKWTDVLAAKEYEIGRAHV